MRVYKIIFYKIGAKEGQSLPSRAYPSLRYTVGVPTAPDASYLSCGFGIYAWSYKFAAACCFNDLARTHGADIHLWEGEGEPLVPYCYGEYDELRMKWDATYPSPASLKTHYMEHKTRYVEGLRILSSFTPIANTLYQPPPTLEERMERRADYLYRNYAPWCIPTTHLEDDIEEIQRTIGLNKRNSLHNPRSW